MLLVVTAGALAVLFVLDTLRDVQEYRLERAIDATRDVRWRNILDCIESHSNDLELDSAVDRHPSNYTDED